MKVRVWKIIVPVLLVVSLCSAAEYRMQDGIVEIANQISRSMKNKNAKSVAILDFTELSGGKLLFGGYLSEKLIFEIFRIEGLKVIERNKLNEVLKELTLQNTGMMDGNSIKELGRILGVDALLIGTITDMGTTVDINGRLVNTQSAEILAVTSIMLKKDDQLATMMKPLGSAVIAVTDGAAAAQKKYDITVRVLSATIKDKVVADAEVTLQKEGQASVAGRTDADGKAVIRSVFPDDGSVSLIIKKEGYSTLTAKGPCNGMSYAVSEVLQQMDAFRVVLSWGAEPSDLDLHVVYPNNHINFNKKTGSDAFLDVDDTSSFGPETITIQRRRQGEKYVFAVHNYSANGDYGNRKLSDVSKAKVFVYVGQSLIRSYSVPANQKGGLWVVFAVDGNGAINDIGNVVDIAESGRVESYLKQLIERADFGVARRATAADAEDAKSFTERGTSALNLGGGELAVSFFQKAVERDPNYGPAYEGLARAYEKLNRSAEVMWARRKASELTRFVPANGFRIANAGVALTASSSMANWKQYTFTPDNLIDDNLWTSWQPVTKPTGGVNEWVKVSFKKEKTVTGFEFSNGFRRIDDHGDLYVMNNRIKSATVQFSDGSEMPINFDDTPTERTFMLPTPKKCTWVKFTVNAVYKGTKWNDLAVSEFHVLGLE